MHNTRSIVMDYRRIGDAVRDRFKADKERQLKYHRALVEAFREAGAPGHIVRKLDALVVELGGGGGAS